MNRYKEELCLTRSKEEGQDQLGVEDRGRARGPANDSLGFYKLHPRG